MRMTAALSRLLSGNGWLWLGLFLLAVHSANAAESRQRPNILFLLADDMRPDAIHALGNDIIQTPNLDSLVRSGVTLTRATCGSPICVVSRAEIMTGASTFKNGVLYGSGKFKPGTVFWAETLRDAGYHTWYVGKWHTQGMFKDRGYEDTRGFFSSGGARTNTFARDAKGRPVTGYTGWTFKGPDGKPELAKGVGLTPDISRYFGDAAVELIKRKSEQPFFLHVNFTAPHDPRFYPPGYEHEYSPDQMRLPANFAPEHPFDHGNLKGRDEQLLPWPRTPGDVKEELAVYYALISHLDEQVGKIFAALKATGQWDNTIIIFSSDHGLAIGSHGLIGKQNMYEHTINVPLVIRGPGIPANERSDAQCYLRDLFPTTCELAGVKVPASVQSKSLVPVLTGGAKSVYPFITGYFTDTQRMIRDDKWKLIYYPRLDKFQLFNVKNDPNELKDWSTAPSEQARVETLFKQLKQWFRQEGDPVVSALPAKPD